MHYQSGFNNHFSSEALENTLPQGQNSPQRVAYGLYAEQLSGSAFTAPRHSNKRSWLYRIRPFMLHGEFSFIQQKLMGIAAFSSSPMPPTQMRWDPLHKPEQKIDFVSSLTTMAHNGQPGVHTAGGEIHHYACNTSMTETYFYSADGEFLIVAELGYLEIQTEFGLCELNPKEIFVIPKGVRFQVKLLSDWARGYVCENYGHPFTLPDLGPIGANGLANPRDFCVSSAYFVDQKLDNGKLIAKFNGHLWEAPLKYSPFDVVAWHGNYVPYKYNLELFNTINTVSFDHLDPSVFTVLTSTSDRPGVANIDFVIFPERWMVAEHTFRPPYYHRNLMNEYMGLICGVYDAKQFGFEPGGASLHNCMSAHGPDAKTFSKARNEKLIPEYYHDTLAFMLESSLVWHASEFALHGPTRQGDYLKCWEDCDATTEWIETYRN